MPERIPVSCEISLEGFTARLVLPIDLNWQEAKRVQSCLVSHIADPSSAAKYAVSDPNVYPSLTE